MKKRKNENQLIRFVWSRRQEYDLALLQEVQERNPFSFKKSKSVWEDIAKSLIEGELKMKVTGRSCRERVNDLLKKHRKEEAEIIRSTGATHDETTELKNLLVIVNEMASMKPADKESTIYLKKKKTEGKKIRDAVLNDLSDSDSDDYVNDKYLQNDSAKKTHNNEEFEYITSVNGFFNDDPSLEDRMIYEESLRDGSVSPQNVPSTSSDTSHSIPVSGWQSQTSPVQSSSVAIPSAAAAIPFPAAAIPSSAAAIPSSAVANPSSVVAIPSPAVANPSPAVAIPSSTVAIPSSTAANQSSKGKDNRFSNPKKNLVTFLEKRSEIFFFLFIAGAGRTQRRSSPSRN